MSDKMALSEDLFLSGKLRLMQPVDGYRAATDPVFLAASITAKPGQRVLDIGCGVGAASLCLAARVPGVFVEGVDIQEELIEIAQKNIEINTMGQHVRFIHGDLTKRLMDPKPNSFDHVMANPPFYEAGSGHRPPSECKARAHMEEDSVLADWINYALRMAKPRATVTFINRVERLEETFAALNGRLGEVVLFPLWSMDPTGAQARGAKRFILQGRKGIKTPMKLANGLVVHSDNNSYTARARAVLMDGEALILKD